MDRVFLRADSALYDHSLIVYLERRQVGFAISVPVSPGLMRRMQALDETAWHLDRCNKGALRHWAELEYLPDGAIDQPDALCAGFATSRSGSAAGRDRCLPTPRRSSTSVSSPIATTQGGDEGTLLCLHRGKAGTVEHAHDVLANELAAAALTSQKFRANAVWFRLNVVLYNLLTAFKRLGLPGALHRIRPKRLRFLVLNTGPADLPRP